MGLLAFEGDAGYVAGDCLVSEIHPYAVKSCAGIALEDYPVTEEVALNQEKAWRDYLRKKIPHNHFFLDFANLVGIVAGLFRETHQRKAQHADFKFNAFGRR